MDGRGCCSAGDATGDPPARRRGPSSEGTGSTPGGVWTCEPGDEWQFHGGYFVNISAWERVFASSADGTSPIPVVLVETVAPLRFMPYLAETRADSACFAKPSPGTLTADIAAGGAARQDDQEPKTESSACRQPTSAIPTSTSYVAMFKGRPASDLSREELVEAYTHACRELGRMRAFQARAYELDDVIDETRRAFTRKR